LPAKVGRTGSSHSSSGPDTHQQTGFYFDDTKRYVDAHDISDAERAAILAGNARRIFPRLDTQLKARRL